MTDIPKKVAQTADDGSELPEAVAEMPQETEAPEAIPYLISFGKYKNKLCEIDCLGKNKGNKALFILKEIGTKVFSRVDFQRHNIKTGGIANANEYKKLYSGLAQDIEVRELFLQGKSRIFYFDIEPERILYVVAIRENHFETDKVRR
jgi:hypothetical protein